jgi:hypothetical protein
MDIFTTDYSFVQAVNVYRIWIPSSWPSSQWGFNWHPVAQQTPKEKRLKTEKRLRALYAHADGKNKQPVRDGQ